MNKPRSKRPKRREPARPRDPNVYPKGWNRKRVQAVIEYYDNQSDEEAIAEAEAAYRSAQVTMMARPMDLVPKVEKLLAKRVG